jgi:hypothetical protein
MAVTTSCFRVLAGTVNQARMGRLFVRRLLTLMAVGTGDMAMNRFQEGFADEYFFPWLQRSHIATSTHPFGFFDDLLFRGQIGNNALFVQMAGGAFVNGFDNGHFDKLSAGCICRFRRGYFGSRGGGWVGSIGSTASETAVWPQAVRKSMMKAARLTVSGFHGDIDIPPLKVSSGQETVISNQSKSFVKFVTIYLYYK